ncbi:unnamed protein product, partial [Didymodactylos carnosus]
MAKYHQNNNTFYPNQQHNGYFIENIIGHSSKNGYDNQQYQCSHSSYDPQSNVYYHAKSNKQQHIPPPASTNMQLINSPARSIRRSRSNDSNDEGFQTVINKKSKHQNNYNDRPKTPQQQQRNVDSTNNNIMTMNAPRPTIINSNNHQHSQQSITTASARYALTRYPFPPHIVRFKSNKVTIKQFKEEVTNHFKNDYQTDIEIVNCRASTLKCNNNEMD